MMKSSAAGSPFIIDTQLSGYGSHSRYVRLKCGIRVYMDVPAGICPNCGHTHTELPDFIRPYKHYESSVIQEVVNGKSTDICEADESTMKRWKREHQRMAPHVETLLRTVLSASVTSY
ncbi:hypothetical protein FZ040_00300 [Selenomonas ruminis]|uniref:DUF6431 domain-containing protein n=2 Tax=Selenomonas ruminis TaxID=2593411 RepID=A0A5D6WC26_9FIRM|nr:hypothetical protein FZ040_00300 [Selenomonas sp. mPRGC5]